VLLPGNLKTYQKECILHCLYKEHTMLWLQMGLGKTIISLTTIVDRMRAGQVKRTLIFGPLRVINSVWEAEAQKWTHTKHLTFSIVQGSYKQRLKLLFKKADITLINYENMNWLAEILCHFYLDKKREIPFQMIIYDEISKLKNSTALRMRGGTRDRQDATGKTYQIYIQGWRKLIDKFKFRIGLTGTPASNGYIDLHGQYLAVDNGERLGKYITHYRNSYFTVKYSGWGYDITNIGKKTIKFLISDVTKKMDAKDYLDIPDVQEIDVMLDLPKRIKTKYKLLEKEMFLAFDSGLEVELFNKATLSNKCLQFCNGSPYIDTITKKWEKIHDIKLTALNDVLEEAAGSPVLCAYSFRSDAERIMQHFRQYKPVNLTNEPVKNIARIIQEWKQKKIKLMIGHPASMGHGIDGLQESGSIIVWFGLNWSYELYEQMNGRLVRQGQQKPVTITRLLCKDTADLAVAQAINRKSTDQKDLKSAMDAYRKGVIKSNLKISFI
jgi:SNF2 family DNA or RNA helicase